MRPPCPKCSSDRVKPHQDMGDTWNELDKYKQYRCLKCDAVFVYDVIKKAKEEA